MTTYPTLAQAQEHPDAVLIHCVADDEWQVYEAADELPIESEEAQ